MNTNLDILTSEDYSFYSDMYKDAYGFRPHTFPFNTIEEYKKATAFLGEIVSSQIDEYEIQDRLCKQEFEEAVEKTMITCKCSWSRAFEILMEAEEDSYNPCYENDIEDFLYTWKIYGMGAYELINKYKEEK